MRIVTTAGELEVVQGSDPDLAVVTGTKDALQALVDGIQMSAETPSEPLELRDVVYDHRSRGSKIVTKLELATWVQFEILNFLTYTELPEDL